MRPILFFGFLFLFFASSCEKYRLKQPSYLHFKWDFFDDNAGTETAHLTSGFVYLADFTVSGVRVDGPAVEISQSIPSEQIQFSSSSNLGLDLDVPVGEYTSFIVNLNVSTSITPCFVLKGEVMKGGDLIPIRLEWTKDLELKFESTTTFNFSKKEDYSLVLGATTDQLLSQIPNQIWDTAIVTNEEGIPTIVISETSNKDFFTAIENEISKSLTLRLE